MQIDIHEATLIRQRIHNVEIEDDYLLNCNQTEVLEALYESYFYMMAHEFPRFKIPGRDVAYEVYRDPNHNILKFAVWWSPPPGECYFPELNRREMFDWAQNSPRLRIAVPRQPDLRALLKQEYPAEFVLEQTIDNYDLVGWSDTLHSWIYKKEKRCR